MSKSMAIKALEAEKQLNLDKIADIDAKIEELKLSASPFVVKFYSSGNAPILIKKDMLVLAEREYEGCKKRRYYRHKLICKIELLQYLGNGEYRVHKKEKLVMDQWIDIKEGE